MHAFCIYKIYFFCTDLTSGQPIIIYIILYYYNFIYFSYLTFFKLMFYICFNI